MRKAGTTTPTKPMVFRVLPRMETEIKQAAASRNMLLSEWLRHAVRLGLKNQKKDG